MKFIKDKYSKHKEKINNFLWRALQIFSKQGFAFITFIIFAKFLTPYDYGIYGYMMASVFFLTMFADFGISGSTSKFVAEYNSIDKKKVKAIVYNSGIIIAGLSLFIIILTLLFGKPFLGDNHRYILYTLPVLFFAPMTGLYQGIYIGLKKFRSLSVMSIIVGVISVIFSLILTLNYGLIGALIGQNIQHVLLFTLLAFNHKDIGWKIDKHVMKQISKYALIIGITTLSYYLYTRADIIILGKFGYIKEIAYYNVLNKIFDMIILPFSIYALVSGPEMTAMYAKKRYQEVKDDFTAHVLALIAAGVLISVLAYFTIPVLIKIFLDKYSNSDTLYMFKLLIFLLPIRIIAAYTNGAHTGPTGNAHFSLWPMIIAGSANVILDIYFISLFGFIGVVYSTLICYTFAISTFTIRYYNKLRRLTHEKS